MAAKHLCYGMANRLERETTNYSVAAPTAPLPAQPLLANLLPHSPEPWSAAPHLLSVDVSMFRHRPSCTSCSRYPHCPRPPGSGPWLAASRSSCPRSCLLQQQFPALSDNLPNQTGSASVSCHKADLEDSLLAWQPFEPKASSCMECRLKEVSKYAQVSHCDILVGAC